MRRSCGSGADNGGFTFGIIKDQVGFFIRALESITATMPVMPTPVLSSEQWCILNEATAPVNMGDHMRSTKARPYKMGRRAEHVDQTRLRITEAAVRLHTTVGPAHTSIASIAEEAGVTRLTVYRHFEDLEAVFAACTAHWDAANPRPNVAAWRSIPDLGDRARLAFDELYAWHRSHAEDLYPIHRDAAALPATTRAALAAEDRTTADAIVGGFDDGPDGRLIRALAGHLVGFGAWRSFAVDQGLDHREAVDLAVRSLLAVAADER